MSVRVFWPDGSRFPSPDHLTERPERPAPPPLPDCPRLSLPIRDLLDADSWRRLAERIARP